MPHRRLIASTAKSQRQTFRKRYKALEIHRAELSLRLHSIGEAAQRHPAYKAAVKLLNDIYRKERLAQRLAVLKSAGWLINILEQLSTFDR